MLFITSLVFVGKKSRFFNSIPGQAQKLWNKWELRSAVLFSLFFQILLILLGGRRKQIKTPWIQTIVWIAYLCADWVAAVALGILSHSIEEPKTGELPSFWAPILLLHLGGPDTITAFSLEDNELWLRHLLGLGVQGSIASYVSFKFWSGSMVSLLSILMYVPAIVKYGERTWVLCSASKEQLRASMLDPRDPGQSYTKLIEEYYSKAEEGYRVTIGRIKESPQQHPAVDQSREDLTEKYVDSTEIDDDDILVKGHHFFEIFKRLFAFLLVSFDDWNKSKLYFQQVSPQEAFKLIEVELGFMFDVLYTKATVVHSLIGIILRSIGLCFTIFVFVMFLNVDSKNKHHSPTDLIITYLLLVVAIILDIYAAILLITSDSGYLWLRKHKNKEVSRGLKFLIFQQLRKKSFWATDFKQVKRLCSSRDSDVLQQLDIDRRQQNIESHLLYDRLKWSIDDVDFDQSILIWHIATHLWYHSDDKASDQFPLKQQKEICMLLSDYMVYLLLVCPFMLPEGIGEIRSVDTEEEVNNFLKEKKNPIQDITDETSACSCLLEVNTDIPPIAVKGAKSKSVLFDACRLAHQLSDSFEREGIANTLSESSLREKKWETIRLVWVEMLSYAAAQCKAPIHAKQLGQGGELLTHVWLLMAHFGITEKFEMSAGIPEKFIYR
ncbi:hypothetical protein NE237_008712 [Protea cynaroides]|uniref:DUF4220 domain-containing protein n=1 Tax=Protea cynaroides TaxID=273540 RepID=A0A9Q0KW37_9MAGN|nr:hypothetical protein NE237_008712 [Protea cynaroides]